MVEVSQELCQIFNKKKITENSYTGKVEEKDRGQ